MVKTLLSMFAWLAFTAAAMAGAPQYAIVVSKGTQGDADWAKVVAALHEKHPGAAVVTYDKNVREALPALRAAYPRYTCFVATPQEATREFVAAVHQITRNYNDDPYTDTFWGILTGYDAANALHIAQYNTPLKIQRVLSATPFAIERVPEGRWYSELKAGQQMRKEANKEPLSQTGPADSTAEIVAGLSDYAADMFITSGHASEHDWMLGYTYRNGFFKCRDGHVYGLDIAGQEHDVKSDHPRVYLAVGNCLMGHITGPNCMAASYMNSAGVMQMTGYTVESWYGYAGWGMLDYFAEQPGRYTLAEAFVANENALIHRLHDEVAPDSPDAQGLKYDSEVFVFYGDPAWEARVAPGPLNWKQRLTHDGNRYTFRIVPEADAATFDPVNTNGSQRGSRPIVEFLPNRIHDVKIIEGADLKPVIADTFILVPNPGHADAPREYKVVFEAAN